MLTGKDDKEVVAAETNEVIKSRLKAKLEVAMDFLVPLETRYGQAGSEVPVFDEELMEDRIKQLSEGLGSFGEQRNSILQDIQELTKIRVKAETQLLGIGELGTRYALLDERYASDLQRLDFITEGAHFIEALQDVNCPLCDQMMLGHEHIISNTFPLRQSAIAEAMKIKTHRRDLVSAIEDINSKRSIVAAEKESADLEISTLKKQLENEIVPQVTEVLGQYEIAVKGRADLETSRLERERWSSLVKLRSNLEQEIASSAEPKPTWEGISPLAQRELCIEIEAVLQAWAWSKNPRVEFDEKEYDIVVDGQPRNSHGKGVRAILYSAFTIGLLRHCAAKNRPHFGVVIIDSPLTSFNKKAAKNVKGADGKISAGVEAAFWQSLKQVSKYVQIIVIENKEPPIDVANEVHYEWFSGGDAKDGERAGLVPMFLG